MTKTMEKSIANLTDEYFKTMDVESPNINWKKRVYSQIESLTTSGYQKDLIEKAIRNTPTNFPSTVRREAKDNLIEYDRFYYHPYLQLAPPPPMILIKPDGTFEEVVSSEFYLELKEYFSYKEILEYFHLKFPNVIRNAKRDLGAIKHTYEKVAQQTVENDGYEQLNALDMTLFMIDTALAFSYEGDKKVSDIFNLKDYIEESLYNYKEKIHYASINGLNRTN